MTDETPGKKALWLRIMRVTARVLAVLLVLLIVLLLAINIPAVQTFVAGKIIKSIREKTGTEINIGTIKIAIPNTVEINDLFLSDKNADTMLYMHSLAVDVDLFSLLKNNVSVKNLSLGNVVANVQRKDSTGAFNFQFLIDAFSPDTAQKRDTAIKQGNPWRININTISLKNIRAKYTDVPGGIDLRVNLGDFNATLKKIDLSKQKIDINEVLLKNTNVTLALSPNTYDTKVQEAVKVSTDTIFNTGNIPVPTSIFLALNISADKITIENTNFSLDNTSSPRFSEGIDYQHLHISNLNAVVSNINIDSVGYRADFQNLSLAESCGINIKKLSANAQLTGQQAELKNFELVTDKSQISGNVSLRYQSFNTFLADLWSSEAELNIENTRLNADEIFLFAPFLATDTYAGEFKHSDVNISVKAKGGINNLIIENLELSMLDKTILKTRGILSGLPDISKLTIDVTIDNLGTNLKDAYRFVDPEVIAGIKLPQAISLSGTVKGALNSFKTDVQLKSAYGNINVDAFYANQNVTKCDTFNINFTAQDILAGVILSDTMLGNCDFSGHASGTGLVENQLSGSAILDIQKAQYNAYSYHDIQIESRIIRNVISATASSADSNLNFHLNADADLRETKQKYAVRLDLIKANLQALNFIQKDISISTKFTAELNYAGLNNSDASLGFVNTTFYSGKKSVPVKLIAVKGFSAQDSLRVNLVSDMADGTLSGNIKPGNLQNILLSAYKKYFGIADTNQLPQGKQLAFGVNMHIPPNMLQAMGNGPDTLTLSKLEGIYKSDNNELTAELQMPTVVYAGAYFDTISLVVNGKDEDLSLNFQLAKVVYNTMQIEHFRALEKIKKGRISSEISILDSLGEPRYLFANELEMRNNTFSLSFKPHGLVLNGQAWEVKEGNLLEKRQNEISAQQFIFSNGNQSFGFIADKSQRQLDFTDIDIRNLVNLAEFQGMSDPLRGAIVGKVDFPLPGSDGFINANLEIDSLYIQDTLAGDLVFHIKTANDKMDIDTRLINEQNKLSIIGNVDHLSGEPQLDLDVSFNINDLYRLEKFSFGLLSEMKGKINGKISVRGTTENPDINGFVGFDKTAFKINSLNFLAQIEDEKILLDKQGIHFDDFVIADSLNKKLTLEGGVLTSNFNDFGFDLHLVTNDFQPMNSTSADNALFYGKLSLATDLWLKGDIKNPDIEAQIKIDSATNLTYALPGSELKLVTSEGIVNFLEPDQKYDSIYIAKEGTSLADSIMSRITGLNLALNLKIDPNARFTVDIDPKSGDYLTLSGSANLNLNVDRAGKQSMTGTYEVKSGLYQLSFYNLVKKTFIIVPGSTVSWSGNPKDADLNIAANYTVTTPSTSLMANESMTMSETEKNMFKQRLPYNVKLNILGFLSQPEISFNITLPDRYLTAKPMVATKLTQLNSADQTNALNKQVFALLVTGSFIADNPTATGGSPSSIASTAARNSVNGILAGQMNNVTSKYVRNFDLNFGLTTFDDGTQGSTDPTTELDVQVSKKLFDERVTIEAQSSIDLSGNKNTSTTSSDHNSGEVAVTYKLTQNGEYKLKAYSQTAYDLFDGDIISSGIAVLFTKEFDSLKRKKKTDTGKGKKKSEVGEKKRK
jgi:hypothetical protein